MARVTVLTQFQAATGQMVVAAERLDALDQQHGALVTEYHEVERAARDTHERGLVAAGELARLKEIASLLRLNEEETLAIVDELLPLLIPAAGSHHG